MILEIILVILGFLILFVGGIAGKGIGVFNTLRGGQQDIKTQWSNILTEYQRRADLFYNLIETTKSHKKFEQETLIGITQARNPNSFGNTKVSQLNKMKNLDSLFSKLMMVFESYPKLLSHEQHNKLMDEIRITEDRVNVARTDYNEIVGDFNKVVTTFPSNIFAGLFRIGTEEFFKNEEETTKAPRINLS